MKTERDFVSIGLRFPPWVKRLGIRSFDQYSPIEKNLAYIGRWAKRMGTELLSTNEFLVSSQQESKKY